MQCLWLLLIAFVSVTICLSTFHEHKVVRIPVQTHEELEFLNTLRLTNTTFDFWIEPVAVGRSVDIRVSPEQWTWFEDELTKRNIHRFVTIENVQDLYEKQLAGNVGDSKPRSVADIEYSVYHTYEEIIAWLITLPETYPDLVTLVNLGKSYQGRDILAVKVTGPTGSNKPAIWFDGGLHAREWISPATVIYMLGHILQDYGFDSTITTLVDRLEIYVLPVFNPDGYAFTWSGNRMWRKTRMPNAGSSCIGTDPNRNWSFQWGGAGVSRDPCSDAYLGNLPFSQIEVELVALYIKNAGNFKGYINFHAYSQLWMGPWGYTVQDAPDEPLQTELAGRCAATLQAVHGTQYQYGPISTTIYLASGSSVDYTYAEANVLYSFAVELRDTGSWGFLLPANQIVPSGEETLGAVVLWALEVMNG